MLAPVLAETPGLFTIPERFDAVCFHVAKRIIDEIHTEIRRAIRLDIDQLFDIQAGSVPDRCLCIRKPCLVLRLTKWHIRITRYIAKIGKI